MTKESDSEQEESGFFAPYAEFSKVLRTWFIAFGAGGLALVVTNNDLHRTVKAAGNLYWIAVLLLAGVGIQVLSAFLYKHSMWHLYCAELNQEHMKSRWYKVAESISNAYVFELLGDLCTAGVFVVAIVLFFMSDGQ